MAESEPRPHAWKVRIGLPGGDPAHQTPVPIPVEHRPSSGSAYVKAGRESVSGLPDMVAHLLEAMLLGFQIRGIPVALDDPTHLAQLAHSAIYLRPRGNRLPQLRVEVDVAFSDLGGEPVGAALHRPLFRVAPI